MGSHSLIAMADEQQKKKPNLKRQNASLDVTEDQSLSHLCDKITGLVDVSKYSLMETILALLARDVSFYEEKMASDPYFADRYAQVQNTLQSYEWYKTRPIRVPTMARQQYNANYQSRNKYPRLAEDEEQ